MEQKEENIGKCERCGSEIDISVRYWRKFCSDKCRMYIHRNLPKTKLRKLKKLAKELNIEIPQFKEESTS